MHGLSSQQLYIADLLGLPVCLSVKVHLASVWCRRVDPEYFAPLQLDTHGTVTATTTNRIKRRKLWFPPLLLLLEDDNAVHGQVC